MLPIAIAAGLIFFAVNQGGTNDPQKSIDPQRPRLSPIPSAGGSSPGTSTGGLAQAFAEDDQSPADDTPAIATPEQAAPQFTNAGFDDLPPSFSGGGGGGRREIFSDLQLR